MSQFSTLLAASTPTLDRLRADGEDFEEAIANLPHLHVDGITAIHWTLLARAPGIQHTEREPVTYGDDMVCLCWTADWTAWLRALDPHQIEALAAEMAAHEEFAPLSTTHLEQTLEAVCAFVRGSGAGTHVLQHETW